MATLLDDGYPKIEVGKTYYKVTDLKFLDEWRCTKTAPYKLSTPWGVHPLELIWAEFELVLKE
jgi:hypothetical protein